MLDSASSAVSSSSSTPTGPSFPPTLADLSRNASVISSSSSSDSTPSLLLKPPPRPRPVRTFTPPRSYSPATAKRTSPASPRIATQDYLTRGLGISDETEESLEMRRASARARSQSRPRNSSTPVTTADFQFGNIIGEGSYSTVMRATYLATGHEYAVKVLDKGHLTRHKKLQTAFAEKNTLVKLGAGHPGIVKLHWSFHDQWSLYFVLDLARNGEMQSRISSMGSLSLACAKYYAAQVADALIYMHSKDVIHRDLKPENLLLDGNYRIKITDFGTAKLLEPNDQVAKTFVGTAQYVAPELLEASETSKSSDLWALGCIIYQMISGRFAFQGLSEYLTWQKIKALDYTFPEGFDEDAKNLIQRLLVRDPSQRLGAGPDGMKALKEHAFFNDISWETLWTSPAPPLEPGLVKKVHPLATGEDSNWEDVGATWDEMIENNPTSSLDEIDWAPDAEQPMMMRRSGLNGFLSPVVQSSSTETAPSGEENREILQRIHELPSQVLEDDSETIIDGKLSPERMRAVSLSRPVDVPDLPDTNTERRGSMSTGSPTSSSDGGTLEGLNEQMNAMELERGRSRAETPVQGYGPVPQFNWSSLVLPDEEIIFSSTVESRSIRRRASRLLPLAVSPMKPKKTRQLILTNRRLLCVKSPSSKHPQKGVVIKHEFLLRHSSAHPHSGDKGKDKDSNYIISAEYRGGREFTVINSLKAQTYHAQDVTNASEWTRKINEVLKAQSPSSSPVRTTV